LIDSQRDRIDPASINQNLNTIKSAQNLLAIFGLLIDRYVAITSITGNQPYHIYICTSTYTQCSWHETINDSFLPYSFLIPKQ
jgi:hypothetical protein